MKVLMFGWEFPPHISGGLGTACFGLTSSLADQHVKVLFVIPKSHGDEGEKVQIINASTVPLRTESLGIDATLKTKTTNIKGDQITGITIKQTSIVLDPYRQAMQQKDALTVEHWNYTLPDKNQLVTTTTATPIIRKLSYAFSGTYGPNLFTEVERYAEAAAVLGRENSFDVIHAHDWMTYRAGLAAKAISGKPMIAHVHATEFDRAGEVNIDKRVYQLEREGMEKADHVVAVSEWTKNTIHKHYQIPLEKITVVHNGVVPVTNGKPTSLPVIGEQVVTFLGRITHQKGPHYFIEAARKVLRKFKDAQFIIAGSGDLMPKMIERVAQLRLSDHFHFTGFLKGDQMNKVWSISSVYVMPSVSEPFGITPLEALQAGVPVIISNQSGVAEVLPHAVKVDFWNAGALADAICSILRYPSLSRSLAKNGMEVIPQLSWSKAATTLNKLYHELAKETAC